MDSSRDLTRLKIKRSPKLNRPI